MRGLIFLVAICGCRRNLKIEKTPAFDITLSSLQCSFTKNVRIAEAEELCKINIDGGFSKMNIFQVVVKLVEGGGTGSAGRLVELLQDEEGAEIQVKKCGITNSAGETQCCVGIVTNSIQVKFTYSVVSPPIALDPVSCSSF